MPHRITVEENLDSKNDVSNAIDYKVNIGGKRKKKEKGKGPAAEEASYQTQRESTTAASNRDQIGANIQQQLGEDSKPGDPCDEKTTNTTYHSQSRQPSPMNKSKGNGRNFFRDGIPEQADKPETIASNPSRNGTHGGSANANRSLDQVRMPLLSDVSSQINLPGNRQRHIITTSTSGSFPVRDFHVSFTTDSFPHRDTRGRAAWFSFVYDVIVHLARYSFSVLKFGDLVYLCGRSAMHAQTLVGFFKETISIVNDANPQLRGLQELAEVLGEIFDVLGSLTEAAVLYGIRYVTWGTGVNRSRGFKLGETRAAVAHRERRRVDQVVEQVTGSPVDLHD